MGKSEISAMDKYDLFSKYVDLVRKQERAHSDRAFGADVDPYEDEELIAALRREILDRMSR